MRAHLRAAKGKSAVFLAKRYRRALQAILDAPEEDYDPAELDTPPDQAVALQLVGLVMSEGMEGEASAGLVPDPAELASIGVIAGVAAMRTREALGMIADGERPAGTRAFVRGWDHSLEAASSAGGARVPAFVMVHGALLRISQEGRLDTSGYPPGGVGGTDG